MARDVQRQARRGDGRDNPDASDPNPAGQGVSPQREVYVDPQSLDAGYELNDVRLRPIFVFAGALLVGALIVQIALFFALRWWTGRPLPLVPKVEPVQVVAPEVPGPGLDAAPELGLQRLLDMEAERLSTYGWVDRDAGTVRIPIERAMQLLVENGVPAQEGDAPDFRLPPAFRMDSSGGLRPVGEVRDEAAEEPTQEGAPGDSATEDIVTDEGAAGEDVGSEGATGSDDAGEEGDTLEEGPPEAAEDGDAPGDGDVPGGASTEEGEADAQDEDD